MYGTPKVEHGFAPQSQQGQKPQEVEAGMLGHHGANAEYPYDQIPPNFDFAKLHREAWRVGKSRISQKALKRMQRRQVPDAEQYVGKICQCCTRQVPNESLSIECISKDYAFMGTGLPLYFEYIKSCIIMLLMLFVTSGDYNIITNLAYGSDCHIIDDPKQMDDKEFCASTWVTILSLANKRKDEDYIELQQMLNLISMITLIVLFQFFRLAQREMDLEIDATTTYASDFTIYVKKIPTHVEGVKDVDDELKRVFEEYINKNIPKNDDILDFDEERREKIPNSKPFDRVAAVNLCYNLDEQYQHELNKAAKVAEKQKILSKLYGDGLDPHHPSLKKDAQGYIDNPELRNIQKEIDDIEKELERLEEKYIEGKDIKDCFLGQAFITLQWEHDVQAMLTKNRVGNFMKIFGRQSEIEYHGQKLQIESPPEPTDVYWENLAVTTSSKLIRRLTGYIITGIILGLCTLGIYSLTAVQADAAREQAEAIKNGDKEPHTGVKLLAYAASFLIIVINVILGIVINQIALFEKYSTQTGYNISLASKSSMAQFCNTALITFLINVYITKNTYGAGGLIYNQTYVFLTNAVVPALVNLVDSSTITKWIFMWLETRKGDKSTKTQKQLNELFERPVFNISTAYASVLKNMYVVAFYAAIIPLGLVVTCIALLTHYWVEKYNIARRRCIKFNYGTEMSIQMIEQLEFVLPIYCITNLYWEYFFSDEKDVSNMAIIGIVLGVLNAILPMQEINEFIFPLSLQIDEVVPVDYAEEGFLTDYFRENPATAERARADYTKRIQKHKSQRAKISAAYQGFQ